MLLNLVGTPKDPVRKLVRVKGLEPPLSEENKDLNLARLPVPPHPQQNFRFWAAYTGARTLFKKLPLSIFQQGANTGRGHDFAATSIGFMVCIDVVQQIAVVQHDPCGLLEPSSRGISIPM